MSMPRLDKIDQHRTEFSEKKIPMKKVRMKKLITAPRRTEASERVSNEMRVLSMLQRISENDDIMKPVSRSNYVSPSSRPQESPSPIRENLEKQRRYGRQRHASEPSAAIKKAIRNSKIASDTINAQLDENQLDVSVMKTL